MTRADARTLAAHQAVCLQLIEKRTRLEKRLRRVADLLAGLALDDPEAAAVVGRALKLAGGTPDRQLSLPEKRA